MSNKIQGNVWDACAAHGITGAKLLIMARLADYSNDEGLCYPSVDTICRQLGLGKSTVCAAISWLEAEGWLCRQSRRRGNRSTSNLYQLNAHRLEMLARAERDKVVVLKEQHKTESERPGFEGPDSGCSKPGRSDSGYSAVLRVQNLDPDPSVNSKQDPEDPKALYHDGARADFVNENNSQQKSAILQPVPRSLPANFAPDDDHRVIAGERGVDLATEVANFIDYHRSKGSSSFDWNAAFRVWLRNSRPRTERSKPGDRRRKRGINEPGEPDTAIPAGFRG